MTNRFSFVRYHDLTSADVNCDLHLHTTRTDGKADVQTVIATAVERGLSRIAFTEHVRRSTGWFSDFVREVRTTASSYPSLQVFAGCEAKAMDTKGSFDASEGLLDQCDIVLGSVHRFPDGQGGFLNFASLAADQFAQIEMSLALGLVESAPIDVLAHPGGMYARHQGDFPPDMMRHLMRKTLERGIAIEINSSYLKDLDRFLELCAEINPYVSIGSDMHHLEHLGHCRDQLKMRGVGR